MGLGILMSEFTYAVLYLIGSVLLDCLSCLNVKNAMLTLITFDESLINSSVFKLYVSSELNIETGAPSLLNIEERSSINR